jgi:uncharacterized integral membrane protein (TIGR00698 family)
MENTARQMECEKGTLYIYDKKRKELCTVVIQHERISEIRMKSDKGLAGHTFTTGETVNVEDAYQDPRFNREVDKKSGFKTRSALCMPVKNRSGERVGVAQMLNKENNAAFDEADERLLEKVTQDISGILAKSGRLINLLPGMAMVLAVMATGVVLHNFLLPDVWQKTLNSALIVILIGMVINNTRVLPLSCIPGVRFSMRQLLRLGIVLMGAKLMLGDLFGVGGQALGLIIFLMLTSFTVAHLLGRIMKVPVRLATLIAAGTAICGGSAIAAMVPVIKARDEDFSLAIAANTLLGAVAVLFMPLVGNYFGMTDTVFGTWAGVSVNDTAQVVATGYAFSMESGDIATVIKLTRNALMVAAVLVIGVVYAKWVSGQIGVKEVSWTKRAMDSVPIFVLGFLFMAMLNTFGVFSWLSTLIRVDIPLLLSSYARFFLLTSLASIGLSTDLAKIRHAGSSPLFLAAVTYLALAFVGMVLIMWFGAISF